MCPVPIPHSLQVGEQIKKMPGSNGVNPYAQLVEDAEGLDKIENLQVGAGAGPEARGGGRELGGLKIVLSFGCCWLLSTGA